MRGTGMALEAIRTIPVPDLYVILAELPALEAQDALLAVQVSAFPHWSGSKSDKTAGDRARRDFTRRLERRAYGDRPDYTPSGHRILHNAAEFRQWLTEGDVIHG